MQEKAKYVFEDHTKSIREAIRAGVPIAMGTDAATPHNFFGRNAIELQLMSECGMSSMNAIVSSTANAAKLLGWHDWLGTIEKGKVADLIVLRKNPLDDLRVLSQRQNIIMVLQDGKVVRNLPPPQMMPNLDHHLFAANSPIGILDVRPPIFHF